MPRNYPNMRDALVKMLGIQLPAAPAAPTPDQQTWMDTNARATQAAMPSGPLSTIRQGMDAAGSFVRGLGYNPTDPVPADADASYKAGGLAAAAMPLFAPKSIPGMYSRVERLVESLPETISTAKLQSILKSGRVAQEELNWRKVPEFLAQAGPTVSKQALANHLNANPLDVHVIRKGNPIGTQTLYGRPRPGAPGIPFWNSPPTAEQVESGHYLVQNHPDKYYWKDDIEPTVWENYQIPGYTPGSYREDLLQLGPGPHMDPTNPHFPTNFVGQHWDEPNVLVHARHNERVVPLTQLPPTLAPMEGTNKNFDPAFWVDGRLPDPTNTVRGYNHYMGPDAKTADEAVAKAKMDLGPKGRMLENIQSDWHQRGAHDGYIGQSTAATAPNPQLDINLSQTQQALADKLREAAHAIGEWHADYQEPEAILFPADRQFIINRLSFEAAKPDAPLELRQLHQELAHARVAHDNAVDAAIRLQRAAVPNAPFKDAWPELAIKQQLLDIAHNHPDTKWVGIPPAHVLQARGEDISPKFQDQQLPRTLEKLVGPLGGKVEPIDTGAKPPHAPQPRWDGRAGPHGGFVYDGNGQAGGPQEIFNLLPTRLDAQETIDTARRAIEAQRPNIIAKGTHLTPEILAQIREKGFPLLAALAAARVGQRQPSYFQPQPSHPTQP